MPKNPASPAARKPTPASVPVEETLLEKGVLKLTSVTNVPPVKRKAGSIPDTNRMSFLAGAVVGYGADEKLHTYAADVWKNQAQLWPDFFKGYPAVYTSAAPPAAKATADDLIKALSVLMRIGFLVADTVDVLGGIARSDLRVSLKGRNFILGEEGDGSKLYWPGNAASGVTIGPGYDMGHRKLNNVKDDLISSGVADMMAIIIAGGAEVFGIDAKNFVAQNKDKVTLNSFEQIAVFYKVVPKYEALVVKYLPVSLQSRLFQHEFDALLSLAWNTSRYGTYGCNNDINHLDFVSAVSSWLTLIAGGRGIAFRRDRETKMLTDAQYQIKNLGKAWEIQLMLDVTPGLLRNRG